MRTYLREGESSSEAIDYIAKTFAPEDEHLKKIRAKLREDDKEGINVGPVEGRLLQTLLSLVAAEKVVEVGTLYGYSTTWMARALPKDGKIYSLEVSEENHSVAQALVNESDVKDRVQLILGDALESLKELSSKGPFDVVFIDANKGGYVDYLNWAEENVRPGGLIVGDNTFLFGHVVSGEPGGNVTQKTIDKMKEFNQRLADSTKYQSILIPTSEGLTVAQKRS